MSRAAISSLIFGIYMCVMSLFLVIDPGVLLGLLGLPPVTDVWIRVAGYETGALGIYYLMAARYDIRQFFLWSIPVRAGLFVTFVIFVLLGLVKPVLILFGCVDLFTGIWTGIELRRDAANPRPARS